MKIVSIVGARPQFIKAAALSRELRKRHEEVLVHTGQHYDHLMSGVFFEGLELPPPEVNLGVGSGSHGAQTAAMLEGIERVLVNERPDWVLVYGDTNSTLAGALAAAKLHLKLCHVEAGLRSFNRRMPEEINRVLTDHVSDLLLCPSQTAVSNLANEGIEGGVYVVGDIMQDVLNWAQERLGDQPAAILERFGLSQGGYLLATVHRSENTDAPDRLSGILEAFNALEQPVVFPAHPRTRKAIGALPIQLSPQIRVVEPLSYFEMVALARAARRILTDSGGVQKEAYWLGVPCITLREETEWVETVQGGWNRLAGARTESILEAVREFVPAATRPPLYGNGQAAVQCVDLLEENSPARVEAGALAVES